MLHLKLCGSTTQRSCCLWNQLFPKMHLKHMGLSKSCTHQILQAQSYWTENDKCFETSVRLTITTDQNCLAPYGSSASQCLIMGHIYWRAHLTFAGLNWRYTKTRKKKSIDWLDRTIHLWAIHTSKLRCGSVHSLTAHILLGQWKTGQGHRAKWAGGSNIQRGRETADTIATAW